MLRIKGSVGFTLVELMITITLLGIFAAIAVPSFTSFINNNRVQSASNELASLLQYARSTAVQNNASYIVCQDAGNQWTVRKIGPATNAATLCSLAALRSMDTPTDVSIATNANALPLAFSSNGTADKAANIVTCHDAEFLNGYKITVVKSGSTRTWPKGQNEAGAALTTCLP